MGTQPKSSDRASDRLRQLAAQLFDRRARFGPSDRELGECMLKLTPWMDAYFERHLLRIGVPGAVEKAEELTSDCWEKLLVRNYEVHSNPYAVLCRVRHSCWVDYVEKLRAQRNSVSGEGTSRPNAEVSMDEESWDALIDRGGLHGSAASSGEAFDQQDCIQRKMAEFERLSPARATLLEYVAQGLSSREIAAVLLDKAPDMISKKDEGLVRDRVFQARKAARALFEECRA